MAKISTIDRLAKMASTTAGLDGMLMLGQYAAPLTSAAILRLALRLSTKEARVRAIETATGVLKAGSAIGDARVVTRLVGMLGMISAVLKLYPRPLNSLASLITNPTQLSLNFLDNPKVYSTIRLIAFIGFFIGENVGWLAKQGVLQLQPETIGKLAIYSIRFWAVDVFMTAIVQIKQYMALRARSQSLGVAYPPKGAFEEKHDEVDSAEVKKLEADWTSYQQQVMINYGFLPLAAHWANLPDGLISNPLIISACGTVVSFGKLWRDWTSAAA